MNKLPVAILSSLAVAAIGLSTWSLVRSYVPPKRDIEYTMYVGTNDKETYQLEMTKEEAKAIVHNTLMDHFSDGFTMYEANGVWRDEQRVITLEYTFVCVLEKVDRTEVYKTVDELLVSLNQSTILVVENDAYSVNFYQGSNK